MSITTTNAHRSAANLRAPSETCPACRSSSTTTTADVPDVNSYWRCTACGEVWNVSRARYPTRQWQR